MVSPDIITVEIVRGIEPPFRSVSGQVILDRRSPGFWIVREYDIRLAHEPLDPLPPELPPEEVEGGGEDADPDEGGEEEEVEGGGEDEEEDGDGAATVSATSFTASVRESDRVSLPCLKWRARSVIFH